jgi:hypothetical protein
VPGPILGSYTSLSWLRNTTPTVSDCVFPGLDVRGHDPVAGLQLANRYRDTGGEQNLRAAREAPGDEDAGQAPPGAPRAARGTRAPSLGPQGASMNSFDVRVYSIRRRANRRRPFEVRWYAAGRARSKSFLTGAWRTATGPSWSAAPAPAWRSTRPAASPLAGTHQGRRRQRGSCTRSRTQPRSGRTWRRTRGPAWPTRWRRSPRR